MIKSHVTVDVCRLGISGFLVVPGSIRAWGMVHERLAASVGIHKEGRVVDRGRSHYLPGRLSSDR